MKIKRRNITSIEPLKELPVTDNEAISIGEALKLTSGKLTKASGTNKPTHIAYGACAAGTGNSVPVVDIEPDMEFETQMTANGSSLGIGAKVTLASDGLGVTATTTNGVATITEIPTGSLVTYSPVVVKFE